MDILKAIERNLAFETEYGAGPRLLGGLFRHSFLKRKRYGTRGVTREDVIHEREVNFGPLWLEHRSKNKNLIGNDEYELELFLFNFSIVSSEKDYWIKRRIGPHIGLLRTMGLVMPAALPLGELIDFELTARAGVRFNVSGFIRNLKGEETDDEYCDPDLWDEEDFETEE